MTVTPMLILCVGFLEPALSNPLETAMAQDTLLRAMVNELDRSKSEMRMDGAPPPFFIEHAVYDVSSFSCVGELGSISARGTEAYRFSRTHVRVGDYTLDNSNFGRGGGLGGVGGVPMPIEDEEVAIRQSLWWAADRQYKRAIEEFERKKAFMESKVITDKPTDFSKEDPTVHIEPRGTLSVDPAQVEQVAKSLSRVFRSHPRIQTSLVNLNLSGWNRYLVNTEGTRIRTYAQRCSVAVEVAVQADDGMMLTDRLQVFVPSFDRLPSTEVLAEKCHALATAVVALADLPRAQDSYTGPVLFEAEPATTLLWAQYGRALGGGQRPIGSRTNPADLVNRLNKRILPRSVTLVDDPTKDQLGDAFAIGHYDFDDQGVAARPVTLVNDGRLTQMLMSRNPSKEFATSTGHGRGYGFPRPGVGILQMTTSAGQPHEELTARLIELIEEEDLEYGMRIRRFDAARGGTVLEGFRVYADGREERVRGLELARIEDRAFKRIVAFGDTPEVVNGGGGAGSTVSAPAMLFEELDLAEIDRDFDAPPILPNPFTRTSGSTKTAQPAG
jgi:predicted Zn-dependent protease